MGEHIAFIGGGNMASAMISGLHKQGFPVGQMDVVEPFAEAQERLKSHFGIEARPVADASLQRATIVIWAVKPQTFKEAAQHVHAHTAQALHISVAAGIRSESIARWLDNERVIRTVPNTPALIGKGMTGLFARAAVTEADRRHAERIVSGMGRFLWLENEGQLDAVTAISGSGPAYMFYFMEAMTMAGAEMGLSREQAYQLAVGTFIGAGELAQSSHEPPEILRQRVTSKGGTTHAAIVSMEESHIKELFAKALHAAQRRAVEMGNEFGES
ncbi:MAG TPA: pyrroline-5-carboxylate reductase [Rhodoferax sp.]|nr:pyrroline-5-carboxylate reductase [Rhodoferax sp.]